VWCFGFICFKTLRLLLVLELSLVWLKVDAGSLLNDKGSIPKKTRILFFATSHRLVLGSAQSLIQRVPAALSQTVKRPEREDDYCLHTVQRLRLLGALPPLPTPNIAAE
jgi:hypothetical protein